MKTLSIIVVWLLLILGTINTLTGMMNGKIDVFGIILLVSSILYLLGKTLGRWMLLMTLVISILVAVAGLLGVGQIQLLVNGHKIHGLQEYLIGIPILLFYVFALVCVIIARNHVSKGIGMSIDR